MMLLGAIDWHSFFFLVFALLAVGFALGVVFSSNVVHMAFYLTLSLGCTFPFNVVVGIPMYYAAAQYLHETYYPLV